MPATERLVVSFLLPWSLQVQYLSPCSLLSFPLRPPLLFQRLQQPSPAVSVTAPGLWLCKQWQCTLVSQKEG